MQAVHQRSFDVILMDMQMPEMDGLEATRRIRQLGAMGRAVPIIAMTANAMQEDRRRCLEAGMNDFVAKPIDSGELLRKIAAHCRAEIDEAAMTRRGADRRGAEAADLSDDQSDALEDLLNSLEPISAFEAESEPGPGGQARRPLTRTGILRGLLRRTAAAPSATARGMRHQPRCG